MDYRIAVTAGDGIGPEVITQGRLVLNRVGEMFEHKFTFTEGLIGGIAIDTTGSALTDDVVAMAKKSDAVLLGAVGGPKWDDPKAKVRPEDGLLRLRKELGLFANLRPVKSQKQLVDSTPLKREFVDGVDMIVIRELTGGLYFGSPKERRVGPHGREAVDTLFYTEQECERVIRVGFELARQRRKRLHSVDKANVLKTSQLWREVAMEVHKDYADVELRHMLVDACAMNLVRDPKSFDVIVTENTFGDILTDEAAVLAGSMGMLPSASLGASSGKTGKSFGLYEPIHGSAPDIAGQDKANPIATILSVAMLLRLSLGLNREADAVEAAVQTVLNQDYRTGDIKTPNAKLVGTKEMGRLITAAIK